MVKGEIRTGRISDRIDIIDAYIIDELNERKRQQNIDGASAQLPYPHYEYEMELDESSVEDDDDNVIIIDL